MAVVAAAFADPLLEFASNIGAFGECNCTDHSNLDIVPVLAIGLILAIVLAWLGIRNLLASEFIPTRSTWASSREPLSLAELARLLLAIFPIQITLLFIMETTEQFIVGGHALGGTIWLGAPVPISLAVHAAIGIIFTVLIDRVVFAFTRKAVGVVVSLRRWTRMLTCRPRSCIPSSFNIGRRSEIRPPLLCRIGKRAPPLWMA